MKEKNYNFVTMLQITTVLCLLMIILQGCPFYGDYGGIKYSYITRVAIINTPPESPKLVFEVYRNLDSSKKGADVSMLDIVEVLDKNRDGVSQETMWSINVNGPVVSLFGSKHREDTVYLETIEYGILPKGMKPYSSEISKAKPLESNKVYGICTELFFSIKQYFIIGEHNYKYIVGFGVSQEAAIKDLESKKSVKDNSTPK